MFDPKYKNGPKTIINHSSEGSGYVIAVDADSEEFEQWAAKEGSEIEFVQCECDGTMRFYVECILTVSYLRIITDQMLSIGEIHGKPVAVWSGVDFEDDA